MNQRTKDEVERLRSIARCLSYDGLTVESVSKHLLLEIAMRLETGWYEKDCDDHK